LEVRFVGLDPATTTGFVALDEQGKVLIAESIKGKGTKVKGGITTEQLVSLENQIYRLLQTGDEIAMEDTAFGTQNGITTGMIHGGIRSMIYRKKLVPNMVNPTATKKYVNVTGWKGENGKKVRLTAKEKKDAVKTAVYEHFGFEHKSHDVIDAYVMAQIALNLYKCREFIPLLEMQPYQVEVIESILQKREAVGR
jgi:crossover junction endodeoxyribonuclease RuvC